MVDSNDKNRKKLDEPEGEIFDEFGIKIFDKFEKVDTNSPSEKFSGYYILLVEGFTNSL